MNETEMDEEGFCTTDLFLAFLGGAAVGAGVALLVAPRSGAETRETLADLARGARRWAARELEGGEDERTLEDEEEGRFRGGEGLGSSYAEP
jgi:gas vesicle protein